MTEVVVPQEEYKDDSTKEEAPKESPKKTTKKGNKKVKETDGKQEGTNKED